MPEDKAVTENHGASLQEGQGAPTWNPMLVWDTHKCPVCGDRVPIGIMSLCATCVKCGAFYADASEVRGWYRSYAAYQAGEDAISTARVSSDVEPPDFGGAFPKMIEGR